MNIMVGEDIRSVAMRNFNSMTTLKVMLKEKKNIIELQESDIQVKNYVLSRQEK